MKPHLVTIAIGCCLALPARANPIMEQFLSAKPLGGCKVEVTVMRLASSPPAELRRSRASFAFENAACSLQVADLAKAERTRAELRPSGDPVAYDKVTLVDEVCADGRWIYRVGPPGASAQSSSSIDDFRYREREVEVKGCASARPCPAQLEAPAAVSVKAPAPPCKVGLLMGRKNVGDDAKEEEKLGEVIEGQDVIRIHSEGGLLKVQVLAPGVAYVKLGGGDECAEFVVEPNEYRKADLETKKRWAYRQLGPRKAEDERVVHLGAGERLTLPSGGTVLMHERDLLRLGVDDQCRPALVAAKGGGRTAYDGALLTEPGGKRHLFFVGTGGDDPSVACRPNSFMDLIVGNTSASNVWPVHAGGPDLIERPEKGLMRPKAPGTAYYSQKPGDDSCMRVKVVPVPESQAARIALMRKDVRNRDVPTTVVEMKKGEVRPLKVVARGVTFSSGGTDVDVDLRKGVSVIVAKQTGFAGLLVNDDQRRESFFYVEVK